MVIMISVVVAVVGFIISVNVAKAAKKKKLKEAAGKGNAEADFNWGIWCLRKKDTLPEAKKWLQKSLESGYTKAKSGLRLCALREEGKSMKAAKERLDYEEKAAQKRLDEEETNARFAEAAIKGTNAQDVVGFKEFEKIPVIRDNCNYVIVKDMCMALVACGYWIGEGHTYKEDGWKGKGGFSVYRERDRDSIGSIMLYVGGSYEGVNGLEIWHTTFADGKFHYIQDFPNIIIDSLTPYYEEPPEWLKICAMVRKKYSPPIEYPNWMTRRPDARKWVNVVFNDVRGLAELNEKIYKKQIQDAFEEAIDEAVDKIVNG